MKKHHIIILATILCLYHLGQSQTRLLRSEEIILPFKIGIDSNELRPQVSPPQLSHGEDFTNLLDIKIDALDFRDGDLIFDYDLVGPDNSFYYKMNFNITRNGFEIPLSRYRVQGDIDSIASNNSEKDLEVRWLDASEYGLYYNQNYNLNVSYQLYGDEITCEAEPTFDKKKLLPHYGLGIVSAGLFTVGQLGAGNRARKNQDALEEAWLMGETAEVGLARREARDNSVDNMEGFLWAAGAVLAIDVIWLGIRYRKHLNRLKLYHRYCKPKMELKPDVSFIDQKQPLYGLKLQYNLSR